MTIHTARNLNSRYRVRVVRPNGEKFDEFFVTETGSKAHALALKKYGNKFRAIVLDWEPLNN